MNTTNADYPSAAGKNRRNQAIKLAGVAFAVLAVLLVAVGFISFIGAREIERNYSAHLAKTVQKLQVINQLHHNSDDVRLILTKLVAPETPNRQKLINQLSSAHDRNTLLVRQLQATITNPANKKVLDGLVKARKQYYIFSDSIKVMAINGKLAQAAAFADIKLAPVDHLHQQYLNKLNNNIQESIDDRTSKAASLLTSFVNYQEIILSLVFLAALCAAILIQNLYKRMRQENMDLANEIAKREKLQAELYKSQQIYKSLFDNNPLPMLIYDLNTLSVMKVNEAAVLEYGYTEQEFSSIKISDIKLTADFEQYLATVKASPKLHLIDHNLRHRRKDGSMFRVEIHSHALPVEEDVMPRLVVALNVEDQYKAIEKIERNEKQLREISSSIPGAVYRFYLTAEYRFGFSYVSDGIRELCGVTPEEVYEKGSLIYKNIHPDDIAAMQQTTLSSFNSLEPWELEFRIWQTHLNKYAWVRGQSLPTKLPDGSVYWNGTFIDITKQKEAQGELTKNEANLKALLDSSPQAIFLLDPQMTVLSFNKVAIELVSKTTQGNLRSGQPISTYVSPEILMELTEDHALALKGKNTNYERGYKGSWYEVSIRPVVSSDNQILAVALSIKDITEQKEAIEIIKSSKGQLSRAHQLAKLGNWEHDLRTNQVSWSEEVFNIYGELAESFEPCAANMLHRVHPADREKVESILQQALKSRAPFAFEHRIVMDDGSIRNIHQICEADFNTAGEPVKLYCTVQDVTDYKKAEREIREAKNMLQSTLENIPEIIFSTGSDYRINFISPQCRDVAGYPEEEFLTDEKLWFTIVHPDDRGKLLEVILPKVLNGERTSDELRIVDVNQETKWIMLRLSPMFNAEGRVVRIDGSVYDMTSYKEAEAKQTELNEQLVQQNQNLQQFAYIVSHNLRAPIANILGLTSIYDRKRPEALMNERVIDNLIVSARLLDTTIRDLNEILTVRSKIVDAKENVNFEQTLQQILASIAEDILPEDTAIEYNFSEAPEIMAVRSYIHSIILNLVTNALKYRSSYRKLELSLKTYKVTDYICLEVKDNGQGINLDRNRDKIFGLYKRFHHNKDGKGIGLHLVRTQAELLGGKVEVDSEVDLGSIFKVYFKHQG